MASAQQTGPLILPLRRVQFNRLRGNTSIGFSESGSVSATVPIEGSTSVAFLTTGRMVAQQFSISPALLPIRKYSFEAPVSGDIEGSVGATFSATGLLSGTAELLIGESVDFIASGEISAAGDAAGSETLAFSTTGLVQATGDLAVSETVGISATAIAQTGNLESSVSIAFSESGQVLAEGQLQASSDVRFVTNVLLNKQIDLDISPLGLPIRRYRFTSGAPIAQGSTSFGFTTDATLTGTASFPSNLQAQTTFAEIFNFRAWLEGKGELQAVGSIDFTASATVSANKLIGTTSIAFSETPDIAATGELAGITSIDFSEVAIIDLIGSLDGSEPIAFSETASLTAKGKLSGLTIVRWINAGQLIRSISGTTSFTFSANAFLSGGDFGKRAGQFYVNVSKDNDVITVEPEAGVIIVEPDPFVIRVAAENDTIIVDAVMSEAA